MSVSETFWSVPAAQLLPTLGTTAEGLTETEASARLAQGGGGLQAIRGNTSCLLLLPSQFKSPIILVLIFAPVL